MQRPSNKSETNREPVVAGREPRREATSVEEANRAKREARIASSKESKERRDSKESRAARESSKESFKESKELKEPKESNVARETKAPNEFAGSEASETNRANSGSSPCNKEGPANSKNNSGRTAAGGGSSEPRATRIQFTKEAPIVMSSGTASSTASGNVPNNETVTGGQTGVSGSNSGSGGVKQRQPSLQQLPQQQINELKKSLQNPKPSALSGGQSNSSLTSANESTGSATGGGGAQPTTGSNVNTSSSSKIVQPNQDTTQQTKRRTSDCQLKQQFGDLSIGKPSEGRSKEQPKDSTKPSKPTTTSSNTASTQQTNPTAALQATASIPSTQSNSSKSANNKTICTTTTMPVLSADYFLNYQKEIERLKTRLEEERRKLNDVPCK